MIAIITKGHFSAEIEEESADFETFEIRITMRSFDARETQLKACGEELMQEYAGLCAMVDDYISSLRDLRDEEKAYAV